MGILSDLRSAVRLAWNDWPFTVTLVATLATGIAASGAIFNVVNASLLRPLPIPDEARVYRLQDYTLDQGGPQVRRSNRVLNFLAIRDEARSFASIASLRRVEWSLVDGTTPVPVKVVLVTSGSLDLLGVRPHAGRLFSCDEEAAGLDSNVLVMSHSLWQRQFGATPGVIGQRVRLEDRVVTIIGIAPPGFRFPYDAEAWMPEQLNPSAEFSVAAFARLAPGVTRAQAEAELDAVAVRAEAIRPVVNRAVRFAMTPIRESLVGNQTRTSVALMGAAVLLLLLASANVANLLLARGIRRAKEVAVRAALGAGRRRQVRQMLIESLVYAALGTAAGLAVAAALSSLVKDLVPNELRDQLGLLQTTVDWRAALFAAVVTCTTGIVAGLVPAFKLARADISDTLRQQTRGATGGHRLMRGLVVGEVSLAVVLLISAGLMIENLQRLLNADLGLRSDHLVSLRMPLPARYDTAERRTVLARQLTDAAAAVPGVEEAGIVTTNPLERGSFGTAIESEDHPIGPGQATPIVNHRLVTSGWLPTAGITLLRGRHFIAADSATSMPVAIVSRRLASRMWPGGDPIGKRIRQARTDAPWITVVGLAGDVRDTGDWKETWYVPYEQHAGTLAAATLHVMMRTAVDPAATFSAMRQSVANIDPLLPVPEPVIMDTLWWNAQAQQRMGAAASAIFASSGLLLAALGTYGVLAYLVSARAREFGIRLALGASPWKVHSMVLREGGTLVLMGLAAGGGLSVAAVRALGSVTTEISGVPVMLPWIVASVLGATAVAATLIPARRATRTSPVDVMRSE